MNFIVIYFTHSFWMDHHLLSRETQSPSSELVFLIVIESFLLLLLLLLLLLHQLFQLFLLLLLLFPQREQKKEQNVMSLFCSLYYLYYVLINVHTCP